MIVWIRKSVVHGYACDQRAEILGNREKFNKVFLVVKLCGTGVERCVLPRDIIGVELTPGITINFNVKTVHTKHTNGKLNT